MASIKTKEQLDTELGIGSKWFPKVLASKTNYLSGINEFDEFIENSKIKPLTNLTIRPHGLEIYLRRLQGLKLVEVNIGLKFDDIISINIEDKEQIFEKKEKSIVGRALIGGLLLGPVGAIVGGMSGLGEKEQKAKMPDILIIISYMENNSEENLLLSCNYNDKNQVIDFMKKHLAEKLFL